MTVTRPPQPELRGVLLVSISVSPFSLSVSAFLPSQRGSVGSFWLLTWAVLPSEVGCIFMTTTKADYVTQLNIFFWKALYSL